MQALRLLALAALVALGVTAVSAEARAAPIDVVVAPRVAASGTVVTVEGGGCTSSVRVTVTGFLWPGTPTLTEDLAVAPDAGGQWQTLFPMPVEPAYIIAECDGVPSPPIVIAPNDIQYTGSASIDVTATEIGLGATSLIDGSEFAIFDTAGALLGSTVVSGETAEVRISRARGAQSVLGLSLSVPINTGLPDPFVPLVREYMLPLVADTTINLTPRVSDTGVTVSAAGICAGTPRLTVTGRTLGWFDIATVFVDTTPTTGPANSWSADFDMPPIAATADVKCTSGTASGSARSVIAASTGGVEIVIPEPDPNSTIIVIDRPSQSMGPYEAFTSTGEPIPLTEAGGTIELDVPVRPDRVVVLGTSVFGENAEALQVQSVQAWYFDVAAAKTTTAPPSTTTGPTTTSSMATAAPAAVAATPEPTLPATGFSLGWIVLAGAVLTLAGLGIIVAARNRRREST